MKVIGGIFAALLILFGGGCLLIIGVMDLNMRQVDYASAWLPLIVGGLALYHLMRKRAWTGFVEPVAQFLGIVLVLTNGWQMYRVVTRDLDMLFDTQRAVYFAANSIIPACGGLLLLYLATIRSDTGGGDAD